MMITADSINEVSDVMGLVDPNGWRVWFGSGDPKRIPKGVDPLDRVVVRLRSGEVSSGHAEWFYWDDEGSDADIVAWKLYEYGD